jgi:hypothetical protein
MVRSICAGGDPNELHCGESREQPDGKIGMDHQEMPMQRRIVRVQKFYSEVSHSNIHTLINAGRDVVV